MIERIVLNAAGLIAGIGVVAGFALTEYVRASRPIAPIPEAEYRQELCEAYIASYDVWFEAGKWQRSEPRWVRAVRQPCWYQAKPDPLKVLLDSPTGYE